MKVYIEEAGSALVRSAIDEARLAATSLVAYVEARAAFARRRRLGDLSAAEHRRIVADFESDWARYWVVPATETLIREAADLADRSRCAGTMLSISPRLGSWRASGARRSPWRRGTESSNTQRRGKASRRCAPAAEDTPDPDYPVAVGEPADAGRHRSRDISLDRSAPLALSLCPRASRSRRGR